MGRICLSPDGEENETSAQPTSVRTPKTYILAW